MSRRVEFNGWTVGESAPCFIVAEAGQNHNGDPDIALALVREAAKSGADAVKFQTVEPEELYDPSNPRFAMCRARQLSREAYESLFRAAREAGIVGFSTPFDERSADFLEEMSVSLFKIGSGELTHHAFLRHVARKGKPMIISTGMANMDQVGAALEVVRDAGNEQIVLLHCVSIYPTPIEKANIRAIRGLRDTYNVPVGLSDHTISSSAAIAAVALGACVIEKHFTLSRTLPGADNSMSIEPAELKALVQSIREVEAALGPGERCVLPEEQELATIARRGIYARVPILKGQSITSEVLAIRRPHSEISADQIDQLLGRVAKVDIPAGEPLRWDQLSG